MEPSPVLAPDSGAGNGIGTNRISIMEDTWKLQQSEILVTDTKSSLKRHGSTESSYLNVPDITYMSLAIWDAKAFSR